MAQVPTANLLLGGVVFWLIIFVDFLRNCLHVIEEQIYCGCHALVVVKPFVVVRIVECAASDDVFFLLRVVTFQIFE